MTVATEQVAPDPAMVERQSQLFDLYNNWPGDGDPDDDPEFVAEARDIMGLPPLTEPAMAVRAAAGHDVTPGHDELHHYWTVGPGLARWRTWTELLANLVEEVHGEPLEVLKQFTSRWFFERYGFYAGDDRNRIMNGKLPRGHNVGPG